MLSGDKTGGWTLIQRNQKLIMNKIIAEMEKTQCDAMILTSAQSIFYSTGFASSFLYKMNQAGLALAVITKKETALIVSQFESCEAKENCSDIEIVTYPTFIYVDDFAKKGEKKAEQNDMLDTFRMAMDMVDGYENIHKIAIEMATLPSYAQSFFEGYDKQYLFCDAIPILNEAKAYKTEWEIQLLRKAAKIDEKAMERIGVELQEGMTHAQIINHYQRYCLEQCDEIIEVNQFHTFGEKFSPTYMLSTQRVRKGDIVRLDGGPTIAGYYSDIARNYAVGGSMTDTQKQIYEALYKGYQTGLQMLEPGMPMNQIFHAISKTVVDSGIDNYVRGHHGHSIGCGTSAEEYPFMGASQSRVLEPGMVMCMEVPYYSSFNHSFNIEDTFLVTENGIEMFTKTEPIVSL